MHSLFIAVGSCSLVKNEAVWVAKTDGVWGLLVFSFPKANSADCAIQLESVALWPPQLMLHFNWSF